MPFISFSFLPPLIICSRMLNNSISNSFSISKENFQHFTITCEASCRSLYQYLLLHFYFCYIILQVGCNFSFSTIETSFPSLLAFTALDWNDLSISQYELPNKARGSLDFKLIIYNKIDLKYHKIYYDKIDSLLFGLFTCTHGDKKNLH